MKSISISVFIFYTASNFIDAAPTTNNSQAVASSQIDQWQKQYNQYIEATVKTHKTGCTSHNMVYRQEWYFSNGVQWGGSDTTLGDPSQLNPASITPMQFNACSESAPSARSPMFLVHAITLMTLLPRTLSRHLMSISAYVSSATLH